MKRPVTLVLVASLLASASALAGNGAREEIAERMAAKATHTEAKRGNDRGHDNRGGNHQRNNDHRDRGNHAPPSRGGHDRRDDRRDHRRDDRRDHDRRDWNDNRNDHNRRDWNDNRRDHDRNDHNRGQWNGHRGWDRPRRDWNNHPNYWDNRRHDRRDHARYRYHFGHYRAPHGYHYRVWHRGDYLPRSYYGHSYIVYDWRPYRLYAPPYGYHWVRVGNDVLLTALATGVVLDVLYDIWY
jgi:Ni/Co efflux regulator RcnB